MDGDTQAVLAGEFYCKQLANSKAAYAGYADLRGAPRKARSWCPTPSATSPPRSTCSRSSTSATRGAAVIKTYSQDTSQAASQATTLASQAKQSGITTLLYFTDPILPIYFTPQLTAQSYFPENIPVGSGFLDYDPLGQLYDQQQWANAFGLGNLAESQDRRADRTATRAYKDGGGRRSLLSRGDGTQSYFSVGRRRHPAGRREARPGHVRARTAHAAGVRRRPAAHPGPVRRRVTTPVSPTCG